MNERLMAEDETLARTSLSRSTRYRMEKRGEFPKRRKISPGRIAWVESEIIKWLEQRTNCVGA